MKIWPIIALHSIVRSVGVRNLILRYRNSSFPFILLNAFKAIDFIDKVSSKTQPRYVTGESCFIFIFLYFTFSVLARVRLLAKIIDFVLSSPKCMVNLLSTNQSQTFLKSLFSCFSISSVSLCWYMRHESSTCKNRFDFTA